MTREAFQLVPIFAALVVGCASSSQVGPPSSRATLAGWGFMLSLPPGVTATRCRPLEDFEEYEFRTSRGVIARAEAGFNPSFRLTKDEKPHKTTIAGLDAIEVERRTGTHRVYEVIVALRASGWDFPRALHIWSDVEAPADEKLFEALVSSAALGQGAPAAVSSCPSYLP